MKTPLLLSILSLLSVHALGELRASDIQVHRLSMQDSLVVLSWPDQPMAAFRQDDAIAGEFRVVEVLASRVLLEHDSTGDQYLLSKSGRVDVVTRQKDRHERPPPVVPEF